MAYGESLKNPGANEVPEGRQSYEGAIKQVKGNLKWSLSFLSTEEILDLLVEVNSTPNNSEELEIRIEYYRSRIRKLEKKKDLLKLSETNSSR